MTQPIRLGQGGEISHRLPGLSKGSLARMTGWDSNGCLESRGLGEGSVGRGHHIPFLSPGCLMWQRMGGQVLPSPKLCERTE